MITVLVTYFFCLFTTLKLIKYHTIIFALSEVNVVTDESSDRQMDKIIYRGRFAPTNKYGSSVINTSVITVYAIIVSTLIQLVRVQDQHFRMKRHHFLQKSVYFSVNCLWGGISGQDLSINLSVCLSFLYSIYLSIYLSIHQTIYSFNHSSKI